MAAQRDGLLSVMIPGVWIDRAPGQGDFWIGRSSSCALRLPDTAVSRQHLHVFPRRKSDGGFEWGVSDESSGGTWVAGTGEQLEKSEPLWFGFNVQLRLAHRDLGPLVTLAEVIDSTARPDHGSVGGLTADIRRRLEAALTQPDRDVLSGVRAGMTDIEIANRLGINHRTPSARLQRCKQRLDECLPGREFSRVQLAELAGWLGIPPLKK